MLHRLRTAWRSRRFSPSPHAGPAQAPESCVLYAVGDIHGEEALLRALLAEIAADFALHGAPAGVTPTLVFIGDYVDRGPDSRGVIDLLLQDPLPGFDRHHLRGNHEAALLDFLHDPLNTLRWLDFGGLSTLASYGVPPLFGATPADRARKLRDALAERLPPSHLTFLAGLEDCVILGDYAFVHAGVRPGVALHRQTPDDLLWIREPFLGSTRHHGKVIVHGHTIVSDVERYPNRIAIDTGAYGSGQLSAIALQGADMRVLRVHRPAARRPVASAGRLGQDLSAPS